MAEGDWYLLVHQIPARPLYLRARILKRLQEAGAVPIKKAVYALPREPWALDALRAVADELRSAGATAFLCEATFPDARDRLALREAVVASQSVAYERLARVLRMRLGGMREGRASAVHTARARLKAIERIGDFGAPGATEVRALMARLERRPPHAHRAAGAGERPGEWTGHRWVTRKSVHVDRTACAWFITRFLDPRASFRFVESKNVRLAEDEVGFDMPGARFAHEGGRCSIEQLILVTGIADPALRRISEIVHDIDLKDERYGHPETTGVERLLSGSLAAAHNDPERIRRASALFDDLYQALLPPQKKPALDPALAGRVRRPEGFRS